MIAFIQETVSLLTTFPGNLVYHLVLAFSVAGAFQAALNLWRESGFPQGRRMVAGLAILLGVRLVLFVSAGVAGELLTDPHTYLPIIDRAVTAFCLLLIIWLWVFPEPQRTADAATGLLGVLILTFTVFSIIWWGQESGGNYFNGTVLDAGWEIFTIALLTLGLLLQITRRPNSWGVGVAMFVILLGGHIYHLALPLPDSDYSGVIRLAEMAAYPLLLALPSRFQVPTAESPPPVKAPRVVEQPIIQDRPKFTVSPEVFHSILAIGSQDSYPKVCQSLTRTIAKTMLADVCLAISPPNNEGELTVQCGYDLIREKNFAGRVFDGKDVPLLVSAIERARPLRLPASSTSRDLFSLSSKLEFGRSGHLLAAFVPGEDRMPILGLVLLSPYSNRGWTREDQVFLSDIADGLAQILQRSHAWISLQEKLEKSEQNLVAFQSLLEDTQAENAGLRTELSSISQQALADQDQNLADITANQQLSIETISRLRAENKRLEELVESLLSEKESQGDSSDDLERELRKTLEEVAALKAQLTVADKKLTQTQTSMDPAAGLSESQIEVFTSIAQELRQPMSSIIGYTELLIGESVGILGALQRKFVDRIKASTERMQVLLDDLFHITTMDGDQVELKSEIVDLGSVIDEAILASSQQLRDRSIILRVDMPDKLPKLQADRDALGQIFINLLQNAGTASPVEGEVSLHASTYNVDNNQEFILVQVADQGGGIPSDDLPRVFSRLYRADNPLIEGVGDTGVGLSIAKTLVEAHNGRIWVDTELGSGSTFSVLIPLLNGSGGDFPR